MSFSESPAESYERGRTRFGRGTVHLVDPFYRMRSLCGRMLVRLADPAVEECKRCVDKAQQEANKGGWLFPIEWCSRCAAVRIVEPDGRCIACQERLQERKSGDDGEG